MCLKLTKLLDKVNVKTGLASVESLLNDASSFEHSFNNSFKETIPPHPLPQGGRG